jgi:hypothetical protein
MIKIITQKINKVKVNKIMNRFQEYFEEKQGEATEALRDIRIVFNKTLQQTQRVNGYGIDEINFDVINEEKAEGGIQLNLEITGTANAKSKEHVGMLLEKLMLATRQALWQKKIFLQILGHRLNVSETQLENETPMGLRRKLHFEVIGAAIFFT